MARGDPRLDDGGKVGRILRGGGQREECGGKGEYRAGESHGGSVSGGELGTRSHDLARAVLMRVNARVSFLAECVREKQEEGSSWRG
jgi:hypothetical protein